MLTEKQLALECLPCTSSKLVPNDETLDLGKIISFYHRLCQILTTASVTIKKTNNYC